MKIKHLCVDQIYSFSIFSFYFLALLVSGNVQSVLACFGLAFKMFC